MEHVYKGGIPENLKIERGSLSGAYTNSGSSFRKKMRLTGVENKHTAIFSR